MKIRRVPGANGEQAQFQALSATGWATTNSVPEFCEWQPSALDKRDNKGALLPFQPLSFRDFMLYESHAINAARGYVRHFMPTVYPLTRLYERITGCTFPRFKPARLWYQQPIYYMSNHLTFVPSGTPLRCPSYSQALDYELELGIVLGRPLINATPEEAMAAIGGFVVINDISARDVQLAEMESGFGPQKTKHFCSSMSETLVTADDFFPEVDSLAASIHINGVKIVQTSTAGMFHSLGEALAHASKDEPLYPGELFGTGTLPGGSGMENGHWLKPGDRIELEIDCIGKITHEVVAS